MDGDRIIVASGVAPAIRILDADGDKKRPDHRAQRLPERVAKVAELGAIARRQGFTMLLLVDETRRELARASFEGGAEILDRAKPE